MLTNPSQIILRNRELVDNHSVLILNYESDLLPIELLETASSVCALALDYHHYLQLENHQHQNLQLHFGHQLPHDERFDTVIIYYPKAKSLTPYLINLAGYHLKPEGQLIITGENKGGIKSITKQMPDYFSAPMKLDNARHCLLYCSELQQVAPQINIEDWTSRYQLTTPQGDITICNLVGVFSEKRLDAGTKLLLEHLPKMTGKVLDFGCGAGVISAAILKAQPTLDIDCIDINAMALEACRLTMQANDIQANIFASNGLSQTNSLYDGIISNPPFHDGLSATTQIAKTFVQDSALKLKKRGLFYIVANRHLPYADIIETHFKQVNVKAETNHYKIYSNIT
ncbi:methyltransferase [Shewanella surugensis]|uniref:Ribosomal RNA small subunit methyltransferase C n=1 Tax=Shewanella surugensis TaxID=212020 RepID=A0ABT0L9L9_9GAMM|nr:methyltransferase [Shewanella surugensis]MCL1124060.1 methyltransferase [Shewanella surugensis]